MADHGPAFAGLRLQRRLWPHQQRALAAFDAALAAGSTSTYLVIPPGGGKTLVGLEAARRLERPTLILCPNTAIQSQWISQWDGAFTPAGTIAATASRDLPTPLTVLTYQAVCTFDNGSTAAERKLPDERLLEMLHPNGQALLARLSAQGPWTLVLDECHHLLELWGRLLTVIVDRLTDAHVIGLTATPPHMMTADQKALHDELFGTIDMEVSAPALVREGRLAPYQELAYVTTPTPPEADYIHGQAVRFAELRAGLLDPGFAATPFLDWLQRRIVDRKEDSSGAQVSWERFEHDEPALAAAALRLHADGMLPLPEGARLREQHRQPPTAEDWVALIGDYCRHCLLASGDPRDERAYEAIRVALPSIGYRLTRMGPRAAESPVDRVLARSASKATATVEILRTEYAELGDQLRALILTDFAEAGGTVPADLTGVMTEGAGGALLALEMLLADSGTAALGPVLMTGQRVACGPDTARRLVDWLKIAAPGLEVAEQAAGDQVVDIEGGSGWEPRRFVPLVTRFFAEGGSRCLVGTRALLGEGWDAPAVNVVIDLTAATTPTSVVQARGRALRLDAGWPEKVADNWAVVCVTGDHPKGGADYDRFVRKHDRYFALSGTGDIISGVAHVDPGLSPFGPPDLAALAELDARMLLRAAERAAVRDRWHIGEPYADEPVATVTVTTRRPLGLSRQYVAGRLAGPGGPGMAARPGGAARLPRAIAGFFKIAGSADTAPSSGSLEDMAMATADALRAAGLVSRGADAVQVEPLPAGGYRARLQDVPASESVTFAAALDEVLAPLAQLRYIVPRLSLPQPSSRGAAIALALRRLLGRGVPATVVYHAVPAALGVNKKLAQEFARAWNARVSPGELLYAGSPEGTGILAAQRGDDPFAVTTQIRTLWR
jgi:superfamily II DNA or RNA helicase